MRPLCEQLNIEREKVTSFVGVPTMSYTPLRERDMHVFGSESGTVLDLFGGCFLLWLIWGLLDLTTQLGKSF